MGAEREEDSATSRPTLGPSSPPSGAPAAAQPAPAAANGVTNGATNEPTVEAAIEAALEVAAMAAGRQVVEERLLEALRREGIAVTERYGDRSGARSGDRGAERSGDRGAERSGEAEPGDEPWPLTGAGSAQLVLWFPGQAPGERAGERAIERVATWLEAQPTAPAMLAVAAAEDVEALLAAGLDDVVPRTISDRELVARIRALHRRMTRRPREGQLRFGALTIDTVERAAWMDGAIISITPIEQAVLVTLIRARGRALSRGALLEAAWSDGDFEISERAVDNVILRLRRKLPRPEVIETVRGVGFRLADGGRELC